MITLLQYYNLGGNYNIRKQQINFWMKSDAYIPEQMAFRKIKVNNKGKIILEEKSG